MLIAGLVSFSGRDWHQSHLVVHLLDLEQASLLPICKRTRVVGLVEVARGLRREKRQDQ